MIAPLPSTWITFHNELAKPSMEPSTSEWYDLGDLPMAPSTGPIDIPRPRCPSPSASTHYDYSFLWSDDDDDDDDNGLNDGVTEEDYRDSTATGEELETMDDIVSTGVLELSPPSLDTPSDDNDAVQTILDMLGTTDVINMIWYHS